MRRFESSVAERVARQRARYMKDIRIALACESGDFPSPCQLGQVWQCIPKQSRRARWKIAKCRNEDDDCDCLGTAPLHRAKRRAFNESFEETDIETEFYYHLLHMDMHANNTWHQGIFDDDSCGDKRKRRSDDVCDCDKSREIHPLRADNETVARLNELSVEDLRDLRDQRLNRKRKLTPSKRQCNVIGMNCFTHDEHHWTTEPRWPAHLGSFCFCQNANNNTYWCVRTVNSTHNTLYCEYITGFVSFYNLNEDPHQLHNIVHTVPDNALNELSTRLSALRQCAGRRLCAVAERHNRT